MTRNEAASLHQLGALALAVLIGEMSVRHKNKNNIISQVTVRCFAFTILAKLSHIHTYGTINKYIRT